MHANLIHHALSSRLHAAPPIRDRLGRDRHIHSVAVSVHEEGPQTAWVTITDRTDSSEPTDHLFSYSWPSDLILDRLTNTIIESYLHVITGDEYVARQLAPYPGRKHPGQVGE